MSHMDYSFRDPCPEMSMGMGSCTSRYISATLSSLPLLFVRSISCNACQSNPLKRTLSYQIMDIFPTKGIIEDEEGQHVPQLLPMYREQPSGHLLVP